MIPIFDAAAQQRTAVFSPRSGSPTAASDLAAHRQRECSMEQRRLRCAAALLLVLAFAALPCRAASGQERSVFADTGLLARPDESAEEILMRAHNQDIGAMLSAMIGYRQGIGGFPRRQAAAAMWSLAVARFNLPSVYAFTILTTVDNDDLKEDETAEYMAACDYALRGRYAPLFKQAEIFDAERACAELAGRVRRTPAWQAVYDKGLTRLRDMQAQTQKTVALAGRLVDSPMTKEDEAAYAQGDFGDPDIFVFYAATTHDPETEAPDWSCERLLRLISSQSEGSEAQTELRFAARSALTARLGTDTGQSSALIRRAHAGEPEAERVMGLNYLTGSQGFPVDANLQNIWIRYSAMHGDVRSMELRAVDLFAGDYPKAAWIWAKLVCEFGDENAVSRAGRIAAELEKLLTPAELEAREKRLKELLRQIFAHSRRAESDNPAEEP
jgi:hypothetical protein